MKVDENMNDSQAIARPNFAAVILLIVLFVAASYLAHAYRGEISALLHAGGAAGEISFVVLTALFVVFVIPLDLVLLVPVGAALWGAVATALLSILGWTIGAGIAFALARRYGRPLIVRIIGQSRMELVERRVPVGNLFWTVVLLRMLVPVDFLSYALGLASSITWARYLLATLIGVAPFGFYFAYAGTLPPAFQAGALALAACVVAGLFTWYSKRKPSP